MDYTQSDSYDTDAGTGHRYHEDAKAIPTIWSGKDANSLLWSLMEIVNAAGLAPKQFNKADASTYGVLLSALRSAGVFQTAAQFDSTTKAATTGFVKDHGVQFGGQNGYTSSATLTASDVGKILDCASSSAFTITLPALAGLPVGGTITLQNRGSGVVTVQRQGADNISVSGSNIASIKLLSGESVTFTVSSNPNWFAFGSAILKYVGSFASNLDYSGFKKVPDPGSPSGFFLFQWGSISTVVGSDVTTTYPIAFPNGILHVFVTGDYTPGSGSIAYHNASTQGSLANFVSRSSGAIGARYLAIGF